LDLLFIFIDSHVNFKIQMRPLQLVAPIDLVPGKTYLIAEKRLEYKHLKCKGVFVKNKYPSKPYECTMTRFTDVVGTLNKKISDLELQDTYWNYYEADATVIAYTNYVLRQITGDPSFVYK